jgi:Icc-related predicted phosphoesterase
MKALVLGDVHGDWTAMNITIAKAMKQHSDITHIVQVGDFADGWPNLYNKFFKYKKSFYKHDGPPNIVIDWCDGNHDNHPLLRAKGGSGNKWTRYHPRGDVMEFGEATRAMFFGGATSYDKEYRTEGLNWWPEESITYEETKKALSQDGPIDAIFSHDHPLSIPYSDTRYSSPDISSKGDRQCLQAVMDQFQPKFWFFGHHHEPDRGIVGQTEWVCCPIIELFHYVIWNGKSIECSWE